MLPSIRANDGVASSPAPLLSAQLAEARALVDKPWPLLRGKSHAQALDRAVHHVLASVVPLLSDAQAMSPTERTALYGLRDGLGSLAAKRRGVADTHRRLQEALRRGDQALTEQLWTRKDALEPHTLRQWTRTLVAGYGTGRRPAGLQALVAHVSLQVDRMAPHPLPLPGVVPAQAPAQALQSPQHGAIFPRQPRIPDLQQTQVPKLSSHHVVAEPLPWAVTQKMEPVRLKRSRGSKRGLSPRQAQVFAHTLAQLRPLQPAEVATLLSPDARRPVRTTSLTIDGQSFAVSNALVRGGFGKIRIGRSAAGELVAVKVLRLRKKDGQVTAVSTAADIRQEVDRLRQLGASTAPMHVWYDRSKHKVYLVMPLHHGDLIGLRSRLQNIPGLLPSAALQAVHGAAHMAARMHREGLMHADIKLDNILLGDDGQFHLGDFGLVQTMAADGSVRNVRGTYACMAPELLRLQAYAGAPADVWALGVAWLAMLSGGQPFAPPRPRTGAAEPRDHAQDLAQVQRRHGAYFSWFARHYSRADNALDSQAINANIGYGKLFATVVEMGHAASAQFIFTRMLHPDPRERASMAEVLDFARTQLRADQRQHMAHAATLKQIGAVPSASVRAAALALSAHQVAAETPV